MVKCAACHGANGLGNGPQASGLEVPVTAIGLADIARQSSPAGWFTIVSQGRIDRYMPAFTSLSSQERWDVLAYVYTLSTTPEELQRGAALFAERCTACHGPDGKARTEANFTDQQFMSQVTGISLYRAVAEGVFPSMPAFSGQLAESDIWALTAHLRTLTFDMTAPTATPQPSATPEPATATPTLAATETTPGGATLEAGVTAEASATSLAADLTPVSATPEPSGETSVTPGVIVGTVSGTVVHGTGGDLPAGLTVALRGFDHGQDATGNIAESVNLSAPLGADGSFSFENVEMPMGRLFLAQVTYEGVPFQSDLVATEAGKDALTLPPLNIYETTNDLTLLSLDQVHIVFDFSVEKTAQIYEIYILTNSSQQAVVVRTDGVSIPFIALPENAKEVGFDIAQGSATFMSAEGGFAILPSPNQYALVAFFTLPYEKKLEVAQPFILAPASVTLFVPEGVKLTGDQLTDAGVQVIQSANFQTYSAQSVAAGSSLAFTVTGSTKSSTTTTTPSLSTQTSLIIGLGGLGLVLILVGLYLFFRDRARRAEFDEDDELEEGEEEETEDALGDNPDSLTDAIIALDDQFKAGSIAKEAYEKRRARLKARLKDLL
jgi:mono/diheme cytochrome c family protein